MNTSRLNKFEQMLEDINTQYSNVTAKLEKLKKENKSKTATFKQLLATKMQYKNMLILYKSYELLDKDTNDA